MTTTTLPHRVDLKVEFGLSWSIRRLRGGYLMATLAAAESKLVDSRFAVGAVKAHIALFGKPPKAYAYDRAGWSAQNVAEVKELGSRRWAWPPRGKAEWQVGEAAKKRLVSERAQVEGGIGTIKHKKYGFNRPAAHSSR